MAVLHAVDVIWFVGRSWKIMFSNFLLFSAALGLSWAKASRRYRGLATCCFCHGVELARGNRNLHLFQCCQGHPCQEQFIRFLSTNVCCTRSIVVESGLHRSHLTIVVSLLCSCWFRDSTYDTEARESWSYEHQSLWQYLWSWCVNPIVSNSTGSALTVILLQAWSLGISCNLYY